MSGAPVAELVRVICTHGGRGRLHSVDAFHREPDVWIGACGVLAPWSDHLGPELYRREPGEALETDARTSRLFFRTAGELPEWRARCSACSRARRDARGRRTVSGQLRMPGAGLASLLDGAAAGWVASIDLFDLANFDGRETVAELAAAQARVTAEWRAEQAL